MRLNEPLRLRLPLSLPMLMSCRTSSYCPVDRQRCSLSGRHIPPSLSIDAVVLLSPCGAKRVGSYAPNSAQSAEPASMRRVSSFFRPSSSTKRASASGPDTSARPPSPAAMPCPRGRTAGVKVLTQSSAEWAGPSAWAPIPVTHSLPSHLDAPARPSGSWPPGRSQSSGDSRARPIGVPQDPPDPALQCKPRSSGAWSGNHKRPRSAGFSGCAGARIRSGTVVFRATAALRISTRKTSSVIPRPRRYPDGELVPGCSIGDPGGDLQHLVEESPPAFVAGEFVPRGGLSHQKSR